LYDAKKKNPTRLGIQLAYELRYTIYLLILYLSLSLPSTSFYFIYLAMTT